MAFDEFFPDPLSEKKKAFESDLLQIENKHIAFFKDRSAVFDWEEHDLLHHHWCMVTNPPKITFGFHQNSELPDYIKTECIAAFQKHFEPS